jgi:hypothetical protein
VDVLFTFGVVVDLTGHALEVEIDLDGRYHVVDVERPACFTPLNRV